MESSALCIQPDFLDLHLYRFPKVPYCHPTSNPGASASFQEFLVPHVPGISGRVEPQSMTCSEWYQNSKALHTIIHTFQATQASHKAACRPRLKFTVGLDVAVSLPSFLP